MRKNLRNFVEFMVVGQMFGMFVLIYWVFVTAYFSPGKMTRIYVDLVGEANVEIVILSFFLVLFFGYVLYRAKVFVKEVKKVEGILKDKMNYTRKGE